MKGRMVRQWIVYCGACGERLTLAEGEPMDEARILAREAGWCGTSQQVWFCPNCKPRKLTGRQAACARGERHYNAKLNEDAVRYIRASREPARALAQRYGVSLGTICNVLYGRSWGHVE